ncbi:MAG: S-methyl-5-thioribose-1-phosphate isomerase [Candidatus Bruticola sp.]
MKPIIWCDDHAELIDQTLLPTEEVWISCSTPEKIAWAIETMKVRGAPAIGVSAAYGLALAALNNDQLSEAELKTKLAEAAKLIGATRPTAVNLFWAIKEMEKVWTNLKEPAEIVLALVKRAKEIAQEDEDMCRTIGKHGASLVPPNARILTHCNAGALATADYGTALGVIRAAFEDGKVNMVWADETRPFLQGARLTAWELHKDNIPVRLICDNMAGHFMQRGQIDMAVVGADRITANGDVANKIGTYSVAVLCKEHNIPFYVAAPYSTIDLNLHNGKDIPIEERRAEELTFIGSKRIAPEGIEVSNPAFDVTPAQLITAIITERGVFRPPFDFAAVMAK